MKKIVIALSMLVTVCLSMLVIAYAAEYKYPDLTWIEKDKRGNDVVVAHYAAREIAQATNIGMLEGYPDGTFKPNDSITKAEFTKALISLATNRTFDFRNVYSKYSSWYGPYVTIAEMQGIIDKNKYSDKELNEPITRIEAILMLAKTQINMKGIPQTQVGKVAYTDIDSLTPDEKALVVHAAQYDLLEGMKDGTETLLDPDRNLTRGEAAAALMRIY